MGFVEIARRAVPVADRAAERGAGDEPARDVFILPRGAQTFDRLVEPGGSSTRASSRARLDRGLLLTALQRQGEMGATKRQIIERRSCNQHVCGRDHSNVRAARSRTSAARPNDSSRSQYRYPASRMEQGYARLRSRCSRSASANKVRGLLPFAGGVERVSLVGA